MARRPRIQIPGLVYHVMSRGNGRMAIFLDATDYRQFVHLLGQFAEDLQITCWNYCVMPNHYHATLQPQHPNLSEAMRRLHGDYAQWWNRRHGRVGHAFQGRFKNQVVDRDTYLLELSRYVVMNPVRAGLVKRPEQWEWSSYRATAGLADPPAFLACSLTHSLFGAGDRSMLQTLFAQHAGGAPADESVIHRLRSSERILGSQAFKTMIAAEKERAERDGAVEEEDEGLAESDKQDPPAMPGSDHGLTPL